MVVELKETEKAVAAAATEVGAVVAVVHKTHSPGTQTSRCCGTSTGCTNRGMALPCAIVGGSRRRIGPQMERVQWKTRPRTARNNGRRTSRTSAHRGRTRTHAAHTQRVRTPRGVTSKLQVWERGFNFLMADTAMADTADLIASLPPEALEGLVDSIVPPAPRKVRQYGAKLPLKQGIRQVGMHTHTHALLSRSSWSHSVLARAIVQIFGSHRRAVGPSRRPSR